MCSQCGGNNNKDPVNLQLIQDVISIKSYVQKLRRILHEPDDSQLIISDETSKIKNAKENQRNGKTSEDEINDLKKQLAILTQQNIEKDQQISSLQRQLDSQTLDSSSTSNTRENSFEFPAKSKINGATQTERVKILSVSESASRSHSSSPAGSLNGEYRSNTAERCRLRRSRTPVNARTPAPSAVFMSPSPNWMTHNHNGTTQNSNNSIYRCSEDGTLRIAIKSNPTVRPKTTSGYYTSNKQQFL